MFRSILLLSQFSAIFLCPGAAFAENPVPVYTPFEARYDRFEEAQGLSPDAANLPAKKSYDEEDRMQAEPREQERVLPRGPVKNPVLIAPVKKFSALESMYSQRAGSEVMQFGYDLFGVPVPETQAHLDELARHTPQMPMGAVQDDFILQAGDELEITFTGQRTDHGLYKVNSQGNLIIPDLPPIPADGRAIGQVRLSIKAAAQNLHNTEAYVSLSSVRQIDVLVMGHVKRPGRQTLTVFHTVIDALMEAGGIDKSGSLRQIKLIRGGMAKPVDLYALLLRGGADIDLQLRDGDRIIVPPIGPTVSITGEVKRPGIYEILPRGKSPDDTLSLADMLNFSGGVLAPGRNRFLAMTVTRGGQETVADIHDINAPLFHDGSILMVAKGQEKRAGSIEITGHTRRPGLYALDEISTLQKLLSSADILGPDPYPLLGVIERRDADTLARQLIAFPLRLVLKGEYDEKLADGDRVRILSSTDIRRLDQPAVKNVALKNDDLQDNVLNDEALSSFLRERSAFVRGAVRSPGSYPVAQDVSLDSLVAAAGGITLEADTANIEITAPPQGQDRSGPKRRKTALEANPPVIVRAGDAVRINQKFRRAEDKTVLLMGEVQNPGRYDLSPGDTISDLLARAGGLTGQAYPDGAIFSRESERKAEEARFRARAREMEAAIAAALQEDHEKVGAGQIAEARALAAQLEKAEGVGRITVEADPYVLKQEPELDMLLEPGDRLYIPKRTLTVRVSGDVLSPVTLQFRKEKTAEDYVNEAGGFTRNADKDRAFVVYPDGSAQPVDLSSWSFDDDAFIPPGSTIIVPRDPEPFDFMESAKDIGQIISNLAITALFIDDVRDDD